MKKLMAVLTVAGLLAVNTHGVLAQTYLSSSTMHRVEYKDTSSTYHTTNNAKGSRVWSEIRDDYGYGYNNDYQTSSATISRRSSNHAHNHGLN